LWWGFGMPKVTGRLYEYVDADGVVYWSFTQHDGTISPPKRLVLQSRRGMVLGNFLVQLRLQGLALMRGSTSPVSPTEGGEQQ
jgi:hypothetical protein